MKSNVDEYLRYRGVKVKEIKRKVDIHSNNEDLKTFRGE